MQKILEHIEGSSKDRIVIGLLDFLVSFKKINTTQGIREMKSGTMIDYLHDKLGWWEQQNSPPSLENDGGLMGHLLAAFHQMDQAIFDGKIPQEKPYFPPHTEKLLYAILFLVKFIWDFSHAMVMIVRETEGDELEPVSEEKPLTHCLETIDSVRNAVRDIFSELKWHINQSEDLNTGRALEKLGIIHREVLQLISLILSDPIRDFMTKEPKLDEERSSG